MQAAPTLRPDHVAAGSSRGPRARLVTAAPPAAPHEPPAAPQARPPAEKVRAEPAGGADLLTALRAPAGTRAAVDPALAGGLRAWLEDGVSALVPPDGRVVVSDAATGLRPAFARILLRLALSGVVPARPFDDALGACAAAGSGSWLVASVAGLRAHQLAALRREAAADAATIAARWRRPPSGWLPRTCERICVPLAGGAVELRATADLVLGAPAQGTASVCLVGVAAGDPARASARETHASRARRFLALVETLRSGAAPFRVATYHSESGVLVADDVSGGMLRRAVREVLADLERWSSRGSAGPPGSVGNGR